DERALAEALRAKQIAGAGLDVWDKEPPAADHPLLQFDNVIASPHTAGMTREARANMGRIAAEQLVMTLDGKRPPRIVNPQVWRPMPSGSSRPSGFGPRDSAQTAIAAPLQAPCAALRHGASCRSTRRGRVTGRAATGDVSGSQAWPRPVLRHRQAWRDSST